MDPTKEEFEESNAKKVTDKREAEPANEDEPVKKRRGRKAVAKNKPENEFVEMSNQDAQTEEQQMEPQICMSNGNMF